MLHSFGTTCTGESVFENQSITVTPSRVECNLSSACGSPVVLIFFFFLLFLFFFPYLFFHSFDKQSNESCDSCGSCSNETNNTTTSANTSCNGSAIKFILKKDRPHVEFDHLSIVSEESQRTPSQEDTNGGGGGGNNGTATATNSHQCHLPGGGGGGKGGCGGAAGKQVPESPLSDLQSVMPPLKHFETIQYENVGPGNVG